jgi:putative oxidoreductase
MNIVFVIARILLGLIFVVVGFNGFLLFMHPPPLSGNIGAWNGAMFASHYMWFTSGVQVIAGVMLLTNQYVPLALVVLGAVLANILVIHITMYPPGLPLALVTTLIWVVASWPLRSHFAQLFARKV